MIQSQNSVYRGTGDASCAAGSKYYSIQFSTTAEAQKIANFIYKEALKNNGGFEVKPKIVLSRRSTTSLMGKAAPNGKITLFNGHGDNVGCLLHELAHLSNIARKAKNANNYGFRRRRNIHGKEFKCAQALIYNCMKANEEKFGIDKIKVKDTNRNYMDPHQIGSITFGDTVTFKGEKKYGQITGTVAAINRKTYKVTNIVSSRLGSVPGRYYRIPFQHPSLKKADKNDVDTKIVKSKNQFSEFTLMEDIINDAQMPKHVEKIKIDKPEPKVEDTDEEIKELIEASVDSLSKLSVAGTLSMPGIVRCFHAHGVVNNEENRKYARDYVKEIGLSIRGTYY
jgi:hypothetical protein